MAVALYAGSFDPIHLGHLGVIECAARAFEEVVVAVVANPAKSNGMFSPQERGNEFSMAATNQFLADVPTVFVLAPTLAPGPSRHHSYANSLVQAS